jgi:hypothetical protein
MNTKIISVLYVVCAAGFLLLPDKIKAQSYDNNDQDNKNTITIHITKEVDGNVVQIDTTIVTDGEFDADAFLKEKGVLNDMNYDENVTEDIAIHHNRPMYFNQDGNRIIFNDTLAIDSDMNINIDEDQIIRQFRNMPFNFSPMEIPELDDIPELNDLQMQRFWGDMPGMSQGSLGNLEKMVVKRKRHGKKVILTFGDENEKPLRKKQKDVRIYNFDNNTNNQSESHTIITPDKQRIIINEEKSEKHSPGKQKKVVIIKQQHTR